VREICMLRSTRRGLETWHGRDRVTLADERARQRGTQTSTYTGAPVLDPTCERLAVKFPGLLTSSSLASSSSSDDFEIGSSQTNCRAMPPSAPKSACSVSPFLACTTRVKEPARTR
jgi:hypothetical protein